MSRLQDLTELNLNCQGVRVDAAGLESALSRLHNLKKLNLGQSFDAKDDLESVSLVENLTELNVVGCYCRGLLDLGSLSRLQSLTSITLGKGVCLESVSRLQSLTSLKVWDCRVDAAGLESVFRLQNLKKLDLTYCIANCWKRLVRKACPGCGASRSSPCPALKNRQTRK